MSGNNEKHDKGDAARAGAKKNRGHPSGKWGIITNAPFLDAVESIRKNQLPRFIKEGDYYVRELTAITLQTPQTFSGLVSIFTPFNLPLSEIRCGDFTATDGREIPPAFTTCKNLAALEGAVKNALEVRDEEGGSFYDNISWKIYLTPEQFAVMIGEEQKGKTR